MRHEWPLSNWLTQLDITEVRGAARNPPLVLHILHSAISLRRVRVSSQTLPFALNTPGDLASGKEGTPFARKIAIDAHRDRNPGFQHRVSGPNPQTANLLSTPHQRAIAQAARDAIGMIRPSLSSTSQAHGGRSRCAAKFPSPVWLHRIRTPALLSWTRVLRLPSRACPPEAGLQHSKNRQFLLLVSTGTTACVTSPIRSSLERIQHICRPLVGPAGASSPVPAEDVVAV
ncbi:hypothetical protein OH76DRAFT_1039752 [Lentinus brumalis]|uniref:Uncharacterized protein n=1 Tax=Lentinus brumalis TaxID=2498619 RepID=A0A371CWY2_9APHY|nr:hypothetical protein OH76DRAFT_1039752 [Polyporus brumalis]